jgi:hypothetical protein
LIILIILGEEYKLCGSLFNCFCKKRNLYNLIYNNCALTFI